MLVKITEAQPGDAKDVLDYLKLVGGQTDHLLFDSGGVAFTLEEEIHFIKTMAENHNAALLVAKANDEIIGIASIQGMGSKRTNHRANAAISVKKAYWHQGVGTNLMSKTIAFARQSPLLEVIELEVRTDNTAAIKLYEKLGFKTYATHPDFMRVDNASYAVYRMRLPLKGGN